MRRPTLLIAGLILTGALVFGGFAGSMLGDAVHDAGSRRARALDEVLEDTATTDPTGDPAATSAPTTALSGATAGDGGNAPSGVSGDPAAPAAGPARPDDGAPELGAVGRPEGLPETIGEPVQWTALGAAISAATAPAPCRQAEALVDAAVNQPGRVRMAWVSIAYGNHTARIDAGKVDGRLRAVLVFATGGTQPGGWAHGSYTWFAALDDGSILRSSPIAVDVVNNGCLQPGS